MDFCIELITRLYVYKKINIKLLSIFIEVVVKFLVINYYICKCKNKIRKFIIWVLNFCNEFYFRRSEGIIFWESEMSFKNIIFIEKNKRKIKFMYLSYFL